jgi:hypothetical protein
VVNYLLEKRFVWLGDCLLMLHELFTENISLMRGVSDGVGDFWWKDEVFGLLGFIYRYFWNLDLIFSPNRYEVYPFRLEKFLPFVELLLKSCVNPDYFFLLLVEHLIFSGHWLQIACELVVGYSAKDDIRNVGYFRYPLDFVYLLHAEIVHVLDLH